MVSAELEPVARTFGTTVVKDYALAAYATHAIHYHMTIMIPISDNDPDDEDDDDDDGFIVLLVVETKVVLCSYRRKVRQLY
jgi:hypothetical protein